MVTLKILSKTFGLNYEVEASPDQTKITEMLKEVTEAIIQNHGEKIREVGQLNIYCERQQTPLFGTVNFNGFRHRFATTADERFRNLFIFEAGELQ